MDLRISIWRLVLSWDTSRSIPKLCMIGKLKRWSGKSSRSVWNSVTLWQLLFKTFSKTRTNDCVSWRWERDDDDGLPTDKIDSAGPASANPKKFLSSCAELKVERRKLSNNLYADLGSRSRVFEPKVPLNLFKLGGAWMACLWWLQVCINSHHPPGVKVPHVPNIAMEALYKYQHPHTESA